MIRTGARILLALAYGVAGVLHIIKPAPFLAITPEWVPWPQMVILFTGVAELLGAAGLMVPRTLIGWARPAAGIGLALYALCVWPANINHAVNHIAINGKALGWGYHAPRLVAQPFIIWWALWASGVIDWPFRRRGPSSGQ